MAWTKMKTAVVVGVGVLLAVGTTTITVKEIQEHTTYSWEVPNWDFSMVDKTPPQVRIVPTKFPKGGWGIYGEKPIGISFSLEHILQAAKGWPSSVRMVLPSNLSADKYDFIANLPNGSKEALELLLRNKFGLAGKFEKRETDVLLLRVKYPRASGLKPSATSQTTRRNGLGTFSVVNQPISTLASFLEDYFQIPVIDQTGLNGSFDMDLQWKDNWQNRNAEGLKQALVGQLGLELVPSREPIEMLVVEKIKK